MHVCELCMHVPQALVIVWVMSVYWIVMELEPGWLQ
jgi:hypothetical protein